MLRPFLIIGVGGSGGKTVRGLRHALTLRLEQAGWRGGIPRAWQLIHIDTPIVQDGEDYAAPFIPPEDYKGLAATGTSYKEVFSSIVYGNSIGADALNDVSRILPDPGYVFVDVTKGAGQYRGVGRAVALSRLAEIRNVASNAIGKLTDSSALGELVQLAEQLGVASDSGGSANPTVIVVSSIAGGSGAGQYLDVIEAVKTPIKNFPWSNQFYALLYAPDVFDNVKGTAGISGNALAAVSETMNGFWTRTPSEASLALYKSRGLDPSYGDPANRVGAAYPLIIGRQNSKVAFANQSEVYSAVSTSIAAWMTDPKVQGDLDSYFTGNWSASVGADVLPDATRLKSPDQSPAFGSLGFGRVTLGRDKFLDYASERFTRAVLDRVLFAHTESDPRFEERTESEWIEHIAGLEQRGFIKAARLDEETEERNDVIDAIRPTEKREQLGEEFRRDVLAISTESGLDKTGGLSLSEWNHRLLTSRDSQAQSYVARDTLNLKENVAAWIKEMPDHLVDTVERSIAAHGLPVTVELLKELSRSLKSAGEGLATEAEQRRGWLSRISSYINEELSAAPNQDSIRPDQDAVEAALRRVADSFDWEVEANLREVVSHLLDEFRRDVVDPLRAYLDSAREALLQRVTEPKTEDGRDNDYPFWPKAVDTTVPRKYTPAPNERLLVPHTEYPAEFDRLVASTFGTARFQDAVLQAITELVTGPDSKDGDDTLSMIRIIKSWEPKTSGDLSASPNRTSAPRFDVSDNPRDYMERARRWMLRPGTAFDSYIELNLREFFDADKLDPAEFKKRRDAFRLALTAALGSSEPLVRLNPALLAEVHGKAIGDGTRLIFSSIPFSEGSEMYQIAKGVLTTAGLWDDNVSPGWFKDTNGDGVEVFAMAGFPYEPMVMDSIMTPIARDWLAKSTDKDSRAAFWKWKRARSLREAVPADAEVFDALIRGWYAAKTLGLLTIDLSDANKGPKIGVWDPKSRSNVSFPYPLLYQGTPLARDYPGAVMESLIVAIVLANSEGSLAPLKPYHVLLDLGGDRKQVSTTLAEWIRGARLPQGAPVPSPARAGDASISLEARRDIVRTYLEDETQAFTDAVVKQDTQLSVYSYPVTWEIRGAVLMSLRELRDGVLDVREEDPGV